METQQFKVSFSVGTKLLVSVVSLLLIVILFLNISAIVLLKDDKRAYIYQNQGTQAVLAARQFVNMATRTINTLRLGLASIDPSKPLTPSQTSSLQAVLDNQSEVTAAGFYLGDFQNGRATELYRKTKEKEAAELQLTSAELEPNPELFQRISQNLLKDGFALSNASKLGGGPVLAVYVADLGYQAKGLGTPVALGYVSLAKQFGNDLGGINLSIVTRSGRLLYDTDPVVFFSKTNLADDPLFVAGNANPVLTGALEYEVDHNRLIGSYVHPGLGLTVLTRTEWVKANRATYQLVEKFILLAAMAIGAAIIFAILFSKTLTAPLGKLYQATKKVSQGEFNVQVPVEGRDEISSLSESFNVMSRKIGLLIQESMEKVKLENEVAIASRVQETLIPPPTFRNKMIFIRSFYMAASQCGGDWWGYFWVGNKLHLMIADATGHGLPSALITAAARSCFSVIQKLITENPGFGLSPGKMLSYANQVVFDASAGQINMTFFMGVIDFDAMTITFANAGHNPPWLFQQAGGNYKLVSLTCPGNRLGEARTAPEYPEKSVQIHPDDVLFLYTDGLTEGKDAQQNQFGKKRVRKLIEANLPGGPEKIINGLLSDFFKHNGEKPLDDDVTLAVARFVPSGDPA